MSSSDAAVIGHDEVLSLVREVVAMVTCVGVDAVGFDSTMVQLGADSLDALCVLSELSIRLDVDMEDDGLERCDTVGDLAAFLMDKLQKRRKV